MTQDYARRQPHSRLKREEKKRAIKTTLIFLLAISIFILLFGFLGINFLAKLSLFVSGLRTPKQSAINQDMIPPTAPQLSVPPSATSSGVISITGFAEPNSLVSLYVNGSKVDQSNIPESGEVYFPQVALSENLNSIYAIAYDDAQNQSARSPTITIIMDNSFPDLVIRKPADSQVFYGPTERTIIIEGQTSPDASLTLNDRVIVITTDGSFSSQFELSEGINLLRFISSDMAGNQTIKEINVSYAP